MISEVTNTVCGELHVPWELTGSYFKQDTLVMGELNSIYSSWVLYCLICRSWCCKFMVIQMYLGKKGVRWYMKKFKKIPLNKMAAEVKVTETGISLFRIFHLHSLKWCWWKEGYSKYLIQIYCVWNYLLDRM